MFIGFEEFSDGTTRGLENNLRKAGAESTRYCQSASAAESPRNRMRAISEGRRKIARPNGIAYGRGLYLFTLSFKGRPA